MTGTIRMTLAYDGTSFHGWARQADTAVRTIEGVVIEVLERVVREPVRLSAGGRTDAGVHARGQTISFSTSSAIGADRLQRALNSALAPEIVAVRAAHASDGFDARFSATAREYRYVVEAAAWPDPFSARYVWHRPGALARDAMRAAALHLVGDLDFASFCKHPGGGRSTRRHLDRLTVSRLGDRYVFGLRADSFLHQMVRSIVGTLVDVGEGRLEPGDLPSIIAARSRMASGRIAPPRGLTLERVVYGRRL